MRRLLGRVQNQSINDVLQYASLVGLGTFERGEPWGSGYTKLDYLRVEL